MGRHQSVRPELPQNRPRPPGKKPQQFQERITSVPPRKVGRGNGDKMILRMSDRERYRLLAGTGTSPGDSVFILLLFILVVGDINLIISICFCPSCLLRLQLRSERQLYCKKEDHKIMFYLPFAQVYWNDSFHISLHALFYALPQSQPFNIFIYILINPYEWP